MLLCRLKNGLPEKSRVVLCLKSNKRSFEPFMCLDFWGFCSLVLKIDHTQQKHSVLRGVVFSRIIWLALVELHTGRKVQR